MKIGSEIEIFRYDPAWAVEFESVRAELKSICGNSMLTVNHVGSTSVPGLDAKPIIDILVGIKDFEQSLQLTPALENLGFVYRPDDELPDRHY
ncbi:MAG: GrpB family protein, partial [Gammaproteobacteria bacterium]|nr:GrpB family protein [Gammaproteobacteria bacterium]